DPSSFRLRWSYWKVGLNMWFHNLFTGVGLGNFALAYPHYQYLGAGDVKECHNGYLQILCETGILGGIFFLFFIITILYKIGKSIKENRNYYSIAWSIGILAFLIHAGLDIHFSHPSLVTYFLIALALFLNEMKREESNEQWDTEEKVKFYLTPLFLVLFCIVIFASSLFPYTRDLVRSRMSFLNVGKDTEIPLVLKSINYVFTDVFEYAMKKSDKQPKMSATILKFFFVDLNKLRMFGNLYVPEGNGSNKATILPEGNPVPDNAVLLVKEPWLLINRIRNSSLHYAEYLKQIDKIFPYQEDIPNYLNEIYKLIFLYSPYETHSEIVNNSREEMLHWAKEAIRRSPYNGDLYYNYGKSLWFSATKDCANPDERNKYIKIAIENFEKCALQWKNIPFYWDEYIAHMKDAVGFFESNNQIEEKNKILEKIEEASRYVKILKEERAKLNLW
ncbi:MAG: O-antigen ligase family protein, partial [Candidatus Hydrogenedens sp.]